ncbi:hypothetical protein Pmani_032024 [Petrolisthes manimaculis]|uniref:G-protein coupled receptors family 1 profile domain-containing protein n=1 Tax=Petrolisthes manimaculis TaxID=1843537 RepID=A0AAE1NTY3_9EUCA|nr:hypothetical protein Pmani_032024 [Petrolisthes manimaculis]
MNTMLLLLSQHHPLSTHNVTCEGKLMEGVGVDEEMVVMDGVGVDEEMVVVDGVGVDEEMVVVVEGVGVDDQVMLGVVGVVMTVMGVVGNGLILVLICRTRVMLCSGINKLLVTGVLCDCLSCMILLPLDIISICLVGRGWLVSISLCYTQATLSCVLSVEGVVVLLAICVDRYYLLLGHQVSLVRSYASWIITSTWVVSFCLALPPLLGVGEFTGLSSLQSRLTHCLWRPTVPVSDWDICYICARFCFSYLLGVLCIALCLASIRTQSAKVHSKTDDSEVTVSVDEEEKENEEARGGSEAAGRGTDKKAGEVNATRTGEVRETGVKSTIRPNRATKIIVVQSRTINKQDSTKSHKEENPQTTPASTRGIKSDATTPTPNQSKHQHHQQQQQQQQHQRSWPPDPCYQHHQHHPYTITHHGYKRRNLTTILLLSLVLVVCRGPFSVAMLIHSLSPDSLRYYQVFTWLLWWAYLQPVLFPVIYVVRISKLRRELEGLFPWVTRFMPEPSRKRRFKYVIRNNRNDPLTSLHAPPSTSSTAL